MPPPGSANAVCERRSSSASWSAANARTGHASRRRRCYARRRSAARRARVAGTSSPSQQLDGGRRLPRLHGPRPRRHGGDRELREAGHPPCSRAGRFAGRARSRSGSTRSSRPDHVATGSDPRIPRSTGSIEAGYWTNREATTLKEVPDERVRARRRSGRNRARAVAPPLRGARSTCSRPASGCSPARTRA